MKIVYPYKSMYSHLQYLEHDYNDDSNRTVCIYTNRNNNSVDSSALNMEGILKEHCDFDFENKKVLDVGMGTGDILSFVRNELKADVYGVDLFSYMKSYNYVKDRTFTRMDVRNVPKEWHNTFDMAYQILYSVPIKQTLSVLKAIAECLKANGIYYVNFFGLDEEYYTWEDSYIVKILRELYHNVEVFYQGSGIIATFPREKPILTSMDDYYYVLTDSQYDDYLKNHDDEVIKKKLSRFKSINKEKGLY